MHMQQSLSVTENKMVLFLTSLLVLIVALAIGQSGWTEGLSIVFFVALGAIVIGLMISKSLLPDLIGHLLSLVIGAGWTFWVISQLLPEAFTWRLRWETMWEHIINWYVLAQQGGVIYDNLMFILQMSIIVWILGYLTVWFMFRSGRIWSAIIPSGIVLLINLYYAPKDLTSWFITYLLLALLLIVRFNLSRYENRWRLEHVHFRSDLSFDILRNGLIFSVVIIALAWLTPSAGEDGSFTMFDRFDRHWRTVQSEWNRLFAGLNYKAPASSNPNAYAQSHQLGGARRLTEQTVMYVDAPGGRYWRAAVYDEYDGRTWNSNDDEQIRFSADDVDISIPQFEAREVFTQTFTPLQEGVFVLYAMANPISIDRPTVARANLLSSDQASEMTPHTWVGQSPSRGEEITYIESDARLEAGESYQVISLRSNATTEQLQADSTDYPKWVEERYLKLPEGTTQRVVDLAGRITSEANNAYDKAEAIERYLRNTIEYNEQIDAPPESVDKVDYILYELQQGYCDYYATSMIVMLRSQGIPARFAAGFARGREEKLENGRDVYRVRNLDAHSWVEVFFPSYGWVEFEPTAAQPVIQRRSDSLSPIRNPGRPENFSEDVIDDPSLLEDQPGFFPNGPLDASLSIYSFNLPLLGSVEVAKTTVNLGIALVAVAGVGAIGWRVIRAGSHDLEDDFLAGEIYAAMLRVAHWMGLGKRPSQTPHEHAAILAENIPPIEAEVNLITDEYVHHKFSPRTTSEASKSRVLNAWEDIRPVLYRAIFERRLPKIRLPFKW